MAPGARHEPRRGSRGTSFALFGITREDALALAGEFGQAAIVWFDGKTAELAWTETPGTVADA